MTDIECSRSGAFPEWVSQATPWELCRSLLGNSVGHRETVDNSTMEREDVLKFTNAIILISKLFTTVEDRFLKQKLHDKLSGFVSAFIEEKNNHSHTSHNSLSPTFQKTSEKDATLCNIPGMSHNVAVRDLLNSINNLLDYLEYLAHISENNTSPLLVAQRNLLKFKLHILQKNKKEKVGRAPLISDVQWSSDVANLPSEVPVTASVAMSKPSILSAQRKKNFGTGTSNKEQIFNYIKKTPDMRTKEIMNEFSALSGRTVKRSLKELTDEGFLKKRSDGAAVYYTCG